MPEFLPISRADMQRRGWEQCDFVYIIGDGYVDHPSFGHAIISRVLERAGYRVAMLPQPDWRDPSSVLEFGEPRLGFLVTGGNMDSMVNHYSVGRHRRRADVPGGLLPDIDPLAALVLIAVQSQLRQPAGGVYRGFIRKGLGVARRAEDCAHNGFVLLLLHMRKGHSAP